MEYFDRNKRKFDALVCLNSSLPTRSIYEAVKYDKLIAADGAARYVFDEGLEPDLIIGDFDSLDMKSIPDDFDISRFLADYNQDTNDFEKILSYCYDNRLNDILIFGLHGGELEHTLNNISVFKKFADKLQMTIYDKARYGVLVDDFIKLQTKKDENISLIPLPEVRLNTKNLMWELNDEILELGVREGARNRATASFIEIKITGGCLLLFFDAPFK
jgi:thiamine pyrophosphokinase